MNDGGFAVLTHGNAFINVWKRPATLAELHALALAEEELSERSPGV